MSALVLSPNPSVHLSSGSFSKPLYQTVGSAGISNLSYGPNHLGNLQLSISRRTSLVVQARNGERPDSTSIFVSGFVLGGAVVGALGLIFAPQLSKVLVGENRKEFLKKIPFYDEEKIVESRTILVDKIEQLNSAIDKVATRLRHNKEQDEAKEQDEDEEKFTIMLQSNAQCHGNSGSKQVLSGILEKYIGSATCGSYDGSCRLTNTILSPIF